MRLLISDANILIDFDEARLTECLFRLPMRFMTPDLLFVDELQCRHAHLIALGLELGELHPESLIEAQVLVARHRRAAHSRHRIRNPGSAQPVARSP